MKNDNKFDSGLFNATVAMIEGGPKLGFALGTVSTLSLTALVAVFNPAAGLTVAQSLGLTAFGGVVGAVIGDMATTLRDEP